MLSEAHLSELGRFCLLKGVPHFFWLRRLNAPEIREMLEKAVTGLANINEIDCIIRTGSFLGKKFHTRLIQKVGSMASRLSPKASIFPQAGPKSLFLDTIFYGSKRRRLDLMPDDLQAVADRICPLDPVEQGERKRERRGRKGD